MTLHTIRGGGGVKLHVVEAGNPKGRRFSIFPDFRNAGWHGAAS